MSRLGYRTVYAITDNGVTRGEYIWPTASIAKSLADRRRLLGIETVSISHKGLAVVIFKPSPKPKP